MKEKKNSVRFEVHDNRVVVASIMSHGQRFVGVAKCSPQDTFNLDYGKTLAEMRARKKVAQADVRFWKFKRDRAEAMRQLSVALGRGAQIESKKAIERIEYNQKMIQDLNKIIYPENRT